MKKLLVVEDQNYFSHILNDILIEEGHEVTVAPDVKSAQKIIEDNSIELIISDLQMPGESGSELYHWTEKRNMKIPIIFMSGYSEELKSDTLKQDRVIGVLEKPFERDEFLGLVEKAFSKE